MIKILGKTETGIYVDEVTPATIYPIYRGIIANTDKHIKFFGESEVETFMAKYKQVYEEELKRRWPD